MFPIGGLAIFLVIRVGRTYGLWGSRLDLFIAGRAPQWLRRVGTGVLLYGHIPPMLSAVVAWFYVRFIQVFTVGLRDPKIIAVAAASRPPGR